MKTPSVTHLLFDPVTESELYENVSGAFARTVAVAEKLAVMFALTAITLFVAHIDTQTTNAPVLRPLSLPHEFLDKRVMISPRSAFDQEAVMTPSQLINRWNPFIAEAAQKFDLPESWIRAVMVRESGGRTMMGEGIPIASSVGAVGVMQLMPETYQDMRATYQLGNNPADPHDSVIAGAAYLKWLHRKYGFPNMFAAYNDGPSNFDKHLAGGRDMPAETVTYLASLSSKLSDVTRTRRKRIIREARVSRSYPVSG